MTKKTNTMRIVLAQINVESKNIAGNFKRMECAIKNAVAQKAHLIIFPEMALPGYMNGDVLECASFLNKCEEYHKKIEKLSASIDILFGSVGIDWKNKNEDGRVRKYNAAFFAHKGKFLKNKKTKFNFWPKTLLPQYREFDDSRHFFDLRKLAYEKKCRVENLYAPIITKYENKIFKIGISICEDLWDENYSFSPVSLFAKKYKHDLFINISASRFTLGKNEKRDSVFSTHAKKLKTPLIYVNCVGTQNVGKTIFTFDGSSKVYSKNGDIFLSGGFCKEENVCFKFEPKNEGKVAQPNLAIKSLNAKSTLQNDKQIHDFKNASSPDIIKTILEHAIKWTCEKWNIKRVVIGVSGGIDSALSAVLFVRVLGCENVFLINLPTKFNADVTKNAATKLAQNLNCPFAIFDINNTVNAKKINLESIVFENSSHKIPVQLSGMNFENIQSRERGAGVLATLASALNAVFSCNANKSEMTIGYSTLYGDMAGFLCPIGDLWKHQVYALAHYYNDVIFQHATIPNEIFNLPPSAELSQEQDVLQGKGDPLIYEYHDYLFASWIEHWNRKTNEDCLVAYKQNTLDALLGLPKGTIKKIFPKQQDFEADLNRWWNLFQGLGTIKRVQAPPIIALSRRAFGLDYRECI